MTLNENKMTDNYTSFFVATLKLDRSTRKTLFYTICILSRLLVGLLFFLKSEELTLSYVSALWGLFWMSLIINNKRWLDVDDIPPWYKGINRFIFRSCIAFTIFLAGSIGIFSHEDRSFANKVTSVAVWIDLFDGVIDYTFFFFN